MLQNKRKSSSGIFLILGLAFLAVGIATDNTTFSYLAVAFVLISLVLGGRWLRPKRKQHVVDGQRHSQYMKREK